MNDIKPNTITHICCLVTGDRFYCWSDEKKEVWELPGLEDMLNRMEDDVVVFDQLVRRKYVGKLLPFITRVRRADPNNIRVLKVDTAMFAFRYRALKGIRWREDFNEADGIFIEELKIANGGVHVVNKTLSYYNWLR
jgi:hypothetical protein